MEICGLKSVLDNYESFQLLNFEEDHKKYIDGKINSVTHLANSWGNIYSVLKEIFIVISLNFGEELVLQ